MSFAQTAFALKSRTVRASAGAFRDELVSHDTWSAEALRQLQVSRATEIARFAAVRSPFYAHAYRTAGVSIDDLRRPGAWERLPVIDRSALKAAGEEVATPDATPKTARPAKTGGSTGEPLQTMHDARVPTLALAWRMYGWWGVEPWDDIARVGRWGFGPRESLVNRVSWWPTRQLYLDASLINDESMHRFAREVRRTRPKLMEGYVGAMLEFADFLEREGLEIPAPVAVATSAAPLTPDARHRLANVFGAPVYDEYRGSEVGWMAGECTAQEGLHEFGDARLIEILDADGSPCAVGQVGDVVITDLTNRVYPIVRYRLGDRGSWLGDECPCGRPYRRLNQPEGRVTDVLRLPSGAALNHRLMAMFSAYPESVRLFQIHQRADHSIVVRVVLGDPADAALHVERAVDDLRRRIAHEVPVTIEHVDSLPYTGGKIKYVISDIS